MPLFILVNCATFVCAQDIRSLTAIAALTCVFNKTVLLWTKFRLAKLILIFSNNKYIYSVAHADTLNNFHICRSTLTYVCVGYSVYCYKSSCHCFSRVCCLQRSVVRILCFLWSDLAKNIKQVDTRRKIPLFHFMPQIKCQSCSRMDFSIAKYFTCLAKHSRTLFPICGSYSLLECDIVCEVTIRTYTYVARTEDAY